ARGLQRWQQHREQGNNDRGGMPKDKKGPIVTHYHPPSSQTTPAISYGPSPPPPYPPGVSPPPPPSQGYHQHNYPPNPYHGGYQPPPPPTQYGHYPPPPPPPPPPNYAPQPHYGQPPFPPSYPQPPGYYSPGTAPPPAPPPPSYPPGTYPPPQYGQPPPPPPSTPYPSHYPTPPPPGAYPFPPGQPPPYGPPAVTGPQYSSPPGWSPSQAGPPPPPPPPPPPTSRSANETPLGSHRGRHQKTHGPKKSYQHHEPNRHAHEKHGKGKSRNERRGRQAGRDEQQRTDGSRSKSESNEPKVQDRKEQEDDKNKDETSGWDPQIREEFQQAFVEVETKPADPVGIPLPVDYTDDPTIPPAYNATCVKSEYFQEDNQKNFVRSIREHPTWVLLKDDPVFRHRQGMVMRRFPDSEHEYSTYDRPDPPPSPSAIKMPPRFRIDRSAIRVMRDRLDGNRVENHDGQEHFHLPQDRLRGESGRERYDGDERRLRKRSFDASPEHDRDERDLKRSRRWSQHHTDRSREDHIRTNLPREGRSPTPPRFKLEGDPWSPQAGETNFRPSNDRRYREYRDVHRETRNSPSREERMSYADKRHDSGYQSGQSLEKGTPRYRNGEWRRRSSERSYRRRMSLSRSRDRSRSRSRTRSRCRSPSRGRSRSHSRASTPSRSKCDRGESPLTALEADLLGLARESSEPETKPVARKPVKRVKVAAAFG
ncbi:hypothetical protein P885DRAFT_45488, partial [Corynascus similis CBS 632.67]